MSTNDTIRAAEDTEWTLPLFAAMADAATRHYLPDDVRARIADGTAHVGDLSCVIDLYFIVRPDVRPRDRITEFIEHGRQFLDDMPPSQKGYLEATIAAAETRRRAEEAVLIAAERIVEAAE